MASVAQLYEVTVSTDAGPRVIPRPLTRRNLELAAELGVHFVSVVPVDVVEIPSELTGERLRQASEIRNSVDRLALPAKDAARVVQTIIGIHRRVLGEVSP
jgi:hypothetical protein